MSNIKLKLEKLFNKFIDKVEGKKADRIAIILYIIALGTIIFNVLEILEIYKNYYIKNERSSIYFFIQLLVPLIAFYISMSGKELSKAHNRAWQFILLIVFTIIPVFSYLAQLGNVNFIKFLNNIPNIDKVPGQLLQGNIKTVSLFIPFFLSILIFSEVLNFILDKKFKRNIAEYKNEYFRKTIYKSNDTSIDIKLCTEQISNKEILLYEKLAFQHTLIQGGSGSGKTATILRPVLEQLFNMKMSFIEGQKELVFQCLQEGLCTLKAPYSNYYMNNNFSMDTIEVIDDKKQLFMDKLKKYVVGVRENETIVFHKVVESGEVIIPCQLREKSHYKLKIEVYESDLIQDKFEESLTIASFPLGLKSQKFKFNCYYEFIEDTSSYGIRLNLKEGYKYKITLNEKASNKIIYKNLGVTVIAPDGGLPNDVLKIGQKYNTKVHRIDPKMEEILKGGIAKYNPLIDGSPEKTGDIISSILIMMDNGDGNNKSNPYFTNASIRAIRNLVIILKVMYPKIYKTNPTLEDILNILNDFNIVVPLVEEMKKDSTLCNRYRSVISYFETCFYPPETDEKGKILIGCKIGAKRAKTEEAIQGIVNQLDNFLGREEIRYILCDRKESLSLSHILENGECISIATRQAELGEVLGKAFAMFFILSIQNAILSRYSEDEQPSIPHYLFIDEYAFYLNDSTKVFFTFARKYLAAVTVVIQNMAQLREISDEFREIIFTNTLTKILLTGINVEDREYWSKLFGINEEVSIEAGMSQTPLFSSQSRITESFKAKMEEKAMISEKELNDLEFKSVFVQYTNEKGKKSVVKGYTDFITLDDKTINIKQFNFDKFKYDDKNLNNEERLIQDVNNKSDEDIYFKHNITDVESLSISNEQELDEMSLDINIDMIELDEKLYNINLDSNIIDLDKPIYKEDINKCELELDNNLINSDRNSCSMNLNKVSIENEFNIDDLTLDTKVIEKNL